MVTDVTDPSPRPGPALLVWAVVGVQVLLVLHFGALGLGWGGVLYTANVLQGVVFLVIAVLLAVRRRLQVVLVPVLSVVLSLGLQGADALLNGTPDAAPSGSAFTGGQSSDAPSWSWSAGPVGADPGTPPLRAGGPTPLGGRDDLGQHPPRHLVVTPHD